MPMLAELAWPILERIRLVGDLAISPHGISIAAGVLIGAQLMLHRALRRGVARRPVTDVEGIVQSLVSRTIVGGILGARFFFVVTHLELFGDPLSWLRVWEGGLSLLGGITGAVLANVPFALRRHLSIPLLLDSVAPGLALGIFIGRIGDLVIGEHLGGPTSFVLGWRCTGAFGDPVAPYPFPGVGPTTVQGCYDVALHQTALYDFLAGGVVLAILVMLERRPRFDGFFLVTFTVLYGGGRFLSDFARAADKDLLGPLTGSQVGALCAIVATLAWVAIRRPDRRRPYAWLPPDFRHPWDCAQPAAETGDIQA
ncbi:MAG: prolipoprotein diacylglyceryl transferase [Euzebyaceae bacterium]|nr:prolipoprotein diacylglyceryl transferase [Euzebyaceae bacterium]